MSTDFADSFHMILPSESNLDIFPENIANNFTIQLDKTKYLNNSYECALFEVILPKLCPIVSFELYLCFSHNYEDETGKKINLNDQIIHTIKIGPETIANKRRYVFELMGRLKKYFLWDFLKPLIMYNFPQFSDKKIIYDPISFDLKPRELDPNIHDFYLKTGHIYLNTKTSKNLDGIRLFLMFDKNLNPFLQSSEDTILPEANVLTIINPYKVDEFKFYTEKEWEFKNETENIFEHIPRNLQRKRLDFYIFCDIVSESYINNEKFPILRLVHCDMDGRSELRFEPMIYYPLIANSLHSIQMKIFDRNFRPVDFQSYSSIIILHLRKIGV